MFWNQHVPIYAWSHQNEMHLDIIIVVGLSLLLLFSLPLWAGGKMTQIICIKSAEMGQKYRTQFSPPGHLSQAPRRDVRKGTFRQWWDGVDTPARGSLVPVKMTLVGVGGRAGAAGSDRPPICQPNPFQL